MAGHSKWANRKHRKERQDQKKGKIFSKVAREITVAARQGGGDPDLNTRLRIAVDKAKAVGCPIENIERAIQRGVGTTEGADLEEIMYEGYGPGGVAILVEAMTNNRNRTAGNLRYLFSRNGGNLGESGCVAWMFERKGLLLVEADGVDEEALLLAAADAGAEDVRSEGGEFEVVTAPDQLENVRSVLEGNGFRVTSSELTFLPKNEVRVAGSEAAQLLRLLDALDDHDDVQEIYANYTIDDAEMARLEAGS